MKKLKCENGSILLISVIIIIALLVLFALPKLICLSTTLKIAKIPVLLHEYETLETSYIQEHGTCGDANAIGWTLPDNDKFFTYSINIHDSGTYSEVKVTPNKVIGHLDTSDVFIDQISAETGMVSHTTTGSMKHIQQYCSSWETKCQN
jgi:hypothetical protein